MFPPRIGLWVTALVPGAFWRRAQILWSLFKRQFLKCFTSEVRALVRYGRGRKPRSSRANLGTPLEVVMMGGTAKR